MKLEEVLGLWCRRGDDEAVECWLQALPSQLRQFLPASARHPLPYCRGCLVRGPEGSRWYARSGNVSPYSLGCVEHRQWLVWLSETPGRGRQLYVDSPANAQIAWLMGETWSGAAERGVVSFRDRVIETLCLADSFDVLAQVAWELSHAGWPVARRLYQPGQGGVTGLEDPMRRTLILSALALADGLGSLRYRSQLLETLEIQAAGRGVLGNNTVQLVSSADQ